MNNEVVVGLDDGTQRLPDWVRTVLLHDAFQPAETSGLCLRRLLLLLLLDFLPDVLCATCTTLARDIILKWGQQTMRHTSTEDSHLRFGCNLVLLVILTAGRLHGISTLPT